MQKVLDLLCVYMCVNIYSIHIEKKTNFNTLFLRDTLSTFGNLLKNRGHFEGKNYQIDLKQTFLQNLKYKQCFSTTNNHSTFLKNVCPVFEQQNMHLMIIISF